MIKIEMTFATAAEAADAMAKLAGAKVVERTQADHQAAAGNALGAEQARADQKSEKKTKPPAGEQTPGPGPSTGSSKTSGEPAAEGVTYEALQAAVFKLANKDRAKAKALMDEFCGAGNTFKVYIDKTDAERVKPMAAVEAALAEAGAA